MAMCSKSHNYIQWAPCIIITCLIISNVIPLYAAPIRTVEAVATKISDGDTIQAVTKEGTKIKRRSGNSLLFKGGMKAKYLKEPYRAQFIQAERVARADKRGIWSQGANYERPSAYRKRMGIGEI